MSIVKGSSVVGGATPVNPAVSSPSGRFEKILGEKTEKKNIKAQDSPSEEQTKERLRALLEGGGSPDEMVRTALAGHPLMGNLSALLKGQLVKNVTAVLSPALKNRFSRV